MTLVAGAYSRHAGDPIPDALCDALGTALSRHSNEQIHNFRDARCVIVKADVGAFGEPAMQVDANAISFMAGEPLLRHASSARRSRTVDLDELHDGLSKDDSEPLTRARGVFCVAHYRPESGTLILATDKLGLRPMYYWLGERYIIFATALRILEELSEVPKVMDVRAVTEINSLGYPLGERTPFASVSLLRAGEILRVQGDAQCRRQYWRWDDIAVSNRPVGDLARDVYRQFMNAVALRCGADAETIAFLSGGLDSRAIVTALHQVGVQVRTFNFSVTGLQDQVLGAAFARQAGTTHTERPLQPRQKVSAAVMAEALAAERKRGATPVDRPGFVWSGDGGSVTLGHVYLNRAIVDLARAGKAEEALQILTRVWGGEVPRRLLKADMLEVLSGAPSKGLLQELDRLHSDDPGRGLHLVLMHNDQRRHLAEHFETIDLHRLEYQLPFFDSDFAASVLQVPLDECLGHRLYMNVLRCFPEVALSVAWQAYPGHEPCPLPVPSGVKYQWGAPVAKLLRAAERRDRLDEAARLLRAPDFPDPILKRDYLRLAYWIYRLRLRDVGYVIRAAQTYYQYWSKCRGNYAPPAKLTHGSSTMSFIPGGAATGR